MPEPLYFTGMTMRTKRRVVALGLLLVAALTGCSGQDGGDGVASAGGTAGGSTSAAPVDDHEAAVKYAQCLRDHGIPVEDPVDGRPPGIAAGAAPDQEVKAAEEACRQHLPRGGKQVKQLDAEDLEKLRQVAKCMREHGYPNFPDPDPDKGGIILGEDSGIDMKDPKFREAQRACGMGGNPQGDGEFSSEKGDG